MLLSVVQLSLRSIRGAKLLRPADLRSTIKCGYSSGWSSRRPVAIVNEHELLDTDDTSKAVEQKTPKTRRRRPRVNTREEKKKDKKENEIKEGSATEQRYIALDANDKLISSLMIDIKTKKRREKTRQMLLEGFRLIEDAIQAGIVPKVIFFNRLSDILPLSLPKEVKLYKIPYRTIQLWSNLTTSPGIIGIFEIPDMDDKEPAKDAIPLTIVCDNVREPGNLGTIIRAAAAVGCEKLLLMKGCVDLWEPKVVRSATGAHFRLPIITSVSWDEIPTLINDESAIFLADNNIAYENDLKDTVNQESTVSTSIEGNDNYTKQDYVNANDDQTAEDNAIDQLTSQTNQYKQTAKTKLLVKKLISQLPVEPYYTLDFTKREMVLVIGGETEGVSLESCKLLRARNCTRVNIPLTNGIDSLNVGVAVGIVTFEMRRQFVTRKIDDE
ncbi:rRNA methyltransferase 3, mitochondrial-like [Temnothorax curvispinosus]|uniref:rRNA methyltransferase 3, mitochondrial-like n=1 Tax=Temnothorax curvispinosus TaxID=300111 RepID=A0A6J1R198_9HYME|nr:rRNA methyltransferase 3, mitochondrial-like [Temnothorax curvispinosus]XP_024891299.1 rRNA methyltransferase 3, mitochondrial-like [Temnothorax curvispinosus]